MAKLTAWLVTIIGLVLVLKQLGWLAAITDYNDWIIALAVLIIGLGKLSRNMSKKRK